MAYQLTSATNPKDLMQKIVDFATAQGWTIAYNNANAATGTVGGQIALSSGNCFFALGEQTATQNPIVVNNAFLNINYNDGRLYGALSKSINVNNKQYWGHPGSIVTSATDGDRLVLNDLWGPMTEVHFFGSIDFIHVLIKCSADRWTHFSFGNLDPLGMTVPKVGYAMGVYHEFWNSSTGITDHVNSSFVGNHEIPYTDVSPAQAGQFNIVDGVLDTALGFVTQPLVLSFVRSLSWVYTGDYLNYNDAVRANSNTLILSHYGNERNQPTTGGVQLHRLPFIYTNDDNSLFCYLGEIPDLRLVHIEDLPIGSEYEYGSDVFMVYPIKRKGVLVDGVNPNYNGQPNTYGMGVAFKKVI